MSFGCFAMESREKEKAVADDSESEVIFNHFSFWMERINREINECSKAYTNYKE